MHPLLAILVLVGFVTVFHLVGTKTEWGKKWLEGVSTFVMVSAAFGVMFYFGFVVIEEAITEGKWAGLWILALIVPGFLLSTFFVFTWISDRVRRWKYRKVK